MTKVLTGEKDSEVERATKVKKVKKAKKEGAVKRRRTKMKSVREITKPLYLIVVKHKCFHLSHII